MPDNLPDEVEVRVIPVSVVRLPAEVEIAVLEVLRSGMIAQGPRVAALEASFAELVGVRHAVAVNNGTTALVAALQVLDLGPGDEVLTSPFTFVATLNAILDSGATATFADIGIDDFNVDPASVGERITEATKVLMPVHLYGQPADMTQLAELAREHGLAVVEDAAQAHGALVGDRPVGSFGIGTFSFYATKNITTGEGGIITTDDDVLADRLRVLRNQGMRERYRYEVAGHNYRMTDLQAALAGPQLEDYPAQVARRQQNARRLIAGLGDLPGVMVPAVAPGRTHVWHQFTLRLTPAAPVSRAEFISRLNRAGVGAGIYYPRTVFDYPCYRAHPRVRIPDVPVASRTATEVVSIPVHPHLTEADIEQVIDATRVAAGGSAR